MHKVALPNELLLSEVSSLLSEGREVVLMTKGVSMLPFIIGDRDSVRLVRCPEYRVGDIVLVKLPSGNWVLHRLFAVEDGGRAILKGDGNLDGVERCRMSDISGRAVAIEHGNGKTTSCTTERFEITSRVWRRSPRFFRHVILFIYHRIVLKLI